MEAIQEAKKTVMRKKGRLTVITGGIKNLVMKIYSRMPVKPSKKVRQAVGIFGLLLLVLLSVRLVTGIDLSHFFARGAVTDVNLTLTGPSSVAVGQTINVRLALETASESTVGVDAVITFDNSRLSLTQITPNNSSSEFRTFLPLNANGVFDGAGIMEDANATGRFSFGALPYDRSVSDLTMPFVGMTDLATLQFRALTTGSTQISFLYNGTAQTNVVAYGDPPSPCILSSSQLIPLTVTVTTVLPTSTPEPTVVPTSTQPAPTPYVPPATSNEWNQDAHDAQRTGYSPEEPLTPWTYAWFWAAPSNMNPVRDGRAIVGGGKVYAPAGNYGIYALNLGNGSQAWRVTNASFNAAAAYDPATQTVLAGGVDGRIYKINAGSGSIEGTFSTGNAINVAVVVVGDSVYAVNDSGDLVRVRIADMSQVWRYSAGSGGATPPSYSVSRNVLVYATDDLYVHAVNNANGSRKWRTKPSPNSAGWPNTFDHAWPVIADGHGVVLIRMQLAHERIFGGPNDGRFNVPMSEIKSWLNSSPEYKSLFALNLDDGSEKFTPAVGYGNVEDIINGQAYGVMGTQPVVKPIDDSEVVYMVFRYLGSSCSGYDYRWSGNMGEMVLDSNTVSGLSAGDLRFIKMNRDCSQGGSSYVFIIDEEVPITVAGNSIFNAHWGASEGVRITDRSASRGLSYSNPIVTTNLPTVVRAQDGCGDTSTHVANCGLTMYGDTRYWDGPGLFVYLNRTDPPGGNTSNGFRPLYTFVSNGYVFVQGNGGDLLVLRHS